MPTIIASATEDEMIATFLRAEANSSRFRPELDQALERLGFTVALITSPDITDTAANEVRRQLLGTYRGWGQRESVFGGMPVGNIEWMWVELEESDLRERVFYIQYFWEELTHGSRRPSYVAEQIRSRDPKVLLDVYLAILDDVRGGRMPAEPILLAEPGMKRLVILEGHLRITAYLVDPVAVSFPIHALVGVSPQMSEWSEW